MHRFVILLSECLEQVRCFSLSDVICKGFTVNQTPIMLQNVDMNLTILGDLKLVKQLGVYTIAPREFQSIKPTMKVLSSLRYFSVVTDQFISVGIFNRNDSHNTSSNLHLPSSMG
jgi:vesicle coat complex subunit